MFYHANNLTFTSLLVSHLDVDIHNIYDYSKRTHKPLIKYFNI